MEKYTKKVYASPQEKIDTIIGSFTNPDAQKHVRNWATEKTMNGIGISSNLYTLRRILNPLKRPISEIIANNDKEAITLLLTDIAKNEKNGKVKRTQKKLLKEFFRWANSGENPKCTAWINTCKTLSEMKPSIKLFTDEEKKLIIRHAPSQRDRTIFSMMNERPLRPKDIVNLKIGDVVCKEYGYEIAFHSKTQKGFRTLLFIHAAPEIRLFLSCHPDRKNPDAPLFFSMSNRVKNQELTGIRYWAMEYALRESMTRAKFSDERMRQVTLYYWRKSTTSSLLQNPNFTTKEIQVMGGWSSIQMLDVYGKVNSEMLNLRTLMVEAKSDRKILKTLKTQAETDKAMHDALIKAGLMKAKEGEEEDDMNVECPRCGTKNPSHIDSCLKCWLALDDKGLERIARLDRKRKIVTEDNSALALSLLELLQNPKTATRLKTLLEEAKQQP